MSTRNGYVQGDEYSRGEYTWGEYPGVVSTGVSTQGEYLGEYLWGKYPGMGMSGGIGIPLPATDT